MTDVRLLDSGGVLTKHIQYGYDALNRRVSESIDADGDGTFDDISYIVNDGLRSSRDNGATMSC